MKTLRSKTEEPKRKAKKNKVNKVVKRCFVKLGRINVEEAMEAVKTRSSKKEVKYFGKSEVKPIEKGANSVGNKNRPKKILASVGLVKREKVADFVPSATKPVKYSTNTPSPDKKRKPLKNIITSHDKALLKTTVLPVLSKRTPKPNRRYINDDIVTKKTSNFYADSDKESDSDSFSAEPTQNDSSSYEDEHLVESPVPKRRPAAKSAIFKSEPPTNRNNQQSTTGPLPVRSAPKTVKSAVVLTGGESKALYKRKLDLDSSDAASPVHKAVLKKKFRKNLPTSRNDNTDDESDYRDSPAVRVRKSNPVLNAIAARKPLTSNSPSVQKNLNISTQLDAKRSALSAALKQKLNTSAPDPQTERIFKSLATKSISANSTPLNSPKFINKIRPSTQQDIKKPRKPVVSIKPVDLEDFEQMPTFTIVNINDIINQKEDVVVLEKKDKRKNVVKNDSDAVDYQPDAESTDEDEHSVVEESKVVNRRKNQHSKILSEKIKPAQTSKSSPPKILNNKLAPVRQLRNVIKQNGVAKEETRNAPRILNSTLCRNTGPTVEPRVLNDTLNNNNVSANIRSKENLIKTFPTPRTNKLDTKPPQPKTVISHQVMQGGSTRRVRKITCFETWFVIKLPAEEQPVHKAELSVSLIQLGNNILQVPLPSAKWSYTISLLRKKNQPKQAEDDDEVYTGEVQDANINPADRHLFVPSNVMFRRKSQTPTLRMQFDRAVILKNNTFYINIEGKNVKLLAAPTTLQSLLDIETLLQIVNEVSLSSPLVEPTNYIA